MIPESFIQELLNRLDIVDVIDRYVPLKKSGANYVACCPFHSEKTPSFTVSPAKQFYHCFGCGAHGTAIRFLMEHQGLGFVEAVQELARGVGLLVPVEKVAEAGRGRGGESLTGELIEVLGQAMRHYRNELKRSETAVAYLKSRGLTGEIAARFGIGYAPPGWRNLAAVFPDYESPLLVQAGLVIEGEGGKRYDRFRDRIMFPILNRRGAVIGFGGRVLGAGEPKYLNSPETPLFEKGRELYGLPQARQAIRHAGRVLVVEGYMDVVALAQHGIGYSVATLGTATTPEHVRILLRQSDHVVFCFDGDEAGRKAAWRALENCLALTADDKTLSYLFLPQGEDPDSYVRRFGKEGFEELIGEALPLSRFLVSELSARVPMETQEGRARFLAMAEPLVRRIAAPRLKLMLRREIAERAGLSATELEQVFPVQLASRDVPKAAPSARKPPSLIRSLLKLLVLRPQLAAQFDADLPDRNAETAALSALLEFLRSQPQLQNTAAILEHFRDTPHERLLKDVSGEILGWDEDFEVEAEFAGALDRLRSQNLARRVGELLAKAGSEGLTMDEKTEFQTLQKRLSSREEIKNNHSA